MSQVNSLAGEEAVGHAVVSCTVRDDGKYAKPEVDPPTPPTSNTHTHSCLYLPLSLSTVDSLQKTATYLFIYLIMFYNFFHTSPGITLPSPRDSWDWLQQKNPATP